MDSSHILCCSILHKLLEHIIPSTLKYLLYLSVIVKYASIIGYFRNTIYISLV